MNLEVIKAMAEFNQKIEDIEKEENIKEIKKGVKEIYKVYKAFVDEGFSEEMAENIILLYIEKGLKGENYE